MRVYYPGIVSYSGMAVGRGGYPSSPGAAFTPAAETARIGEAQADNRRHVRNLPVDKERATRVPSGGELVPQGQFTAPRSEPRAPVMLSFLAQHIAQEVNPEVAGPDRYSSAADAYIGARDFNAEMLPDGAGLDIRI